MSMAPAIKCQTPHAHVSTAASLPRSLRRRATALKSTPMALLLEVRTANGGNAGDRSPSLSRSLT
ncbi:uncharacterized protein J3R85_017773 [Psidium guajava]|nr:uncharacterized protein J3R85_017773 [Psidium guajava]